MTTHPATLTYYRALGRRARWHAAQPDDVSRTLCGSDALRRGSDVVYIRADSLAEALAEDSHDVCKRCAPEQDLAAIAEEYARQDVETLRSIVAGMGPDERLVVDGSMYAPSWRTLDGGSRAWDLDDGDALDAYSETLDRGTDELGLYWEEGCLWRSVDDDDEPAPLDAADALDRVAAILNGSEWDSDTPAAIADVVRAAGRTIDDVPEPDERTAGGNGNADGSRWPRDPVARDQSKYVGEDGRLRYSADGSEVFPGPTGVRPEHPEQD
jgi:hypothetical protein